MPDRGLGRRFAPDPRDANFPMRAALPAVPSVRKYRYWNASGWWFDQGDRPICVGASLAMWLEDGPVTQRGRAPVLTPEIIYHEAQLVDEWPGEDYEGTSVRAGMKVLKARGFVDTYRWAQNVDDVVQSLLEVGPVVIGIPWYESMFQPDEAGLMHVGGSVAGGHAIKVDGINVAHGLVRLKNSWGKDFGVGGFCYLAIDDLERLLNEDGEAGLAVEVRK